MAYLKPYTHPGTLQESPRAYHRVVGIDDSQAHLGRLVCVVEVYANKEAASRPDPIVETRAGQGDSVIRTETPHPRRSKADPVGAYTVVIDDLGVVESITLKKSPLPAPQGITERERYSPKAQAYRHLRSLPELADAEDDK